MTVTESVRAPVVRPSGPIDAVAEVRALYAWTLQQRAATFHAAADTLNTAKRRTLTLDEHVRLESLSREIELLDDRADRLARLVDRLIDAGED